ncbi:hypothetical protein DFH11DRAFT_560403 [Phellopilus nigrolimitatus]|nr:hypothetical protein DFH11DRAFT_560403 [Phellopilus nigrolimitatus]
MSHPDIADGRHGPYVYLIKAALRAVEMPVPTSLQVAASANIELESSGVGMSAMLGATVGSILIASWFAAALTGVMFLQAYLYFRSRPKGDSKIYSCIVLVLCGLDAAHIVCVVVSLYHYLIRSFGNDDALNDVTPSLALSVGITAFVTIIVQSFFCWRVWKLSRTFKLVPPIIIVLLLARLGCGLAATIKAIELKTFSGFIAHLRWVFTAGLALGVICDVLITASLCFWLYRSRRETHSSNKTLDKIIIYTVENGALTSLTSIASLLCVVTMPGNLVFLAVHIIISKLFINAFLASLNARNSIRAQKEQSTQAHRVLSGLYFASPPRTSGRAEVRRDLSNR